MPRANRYFIPGKVWHLTHRCHEKKYHLQFARDRRRYLHWLRESRRRYGLHVLNYMITSNHAHLLVIDRGEPEAISRSLQLMAGRTGQEYNDRKQRHGAFWEDRYHATAVETGEHFHACMVYIDLNMVRAGAVRHPIEWPWCGYYELQHPRVRGSGVDFDNLMALYRVEGIEPLQEISRRNVETALRMEGGAMRRNGSWSESVAVGSEEYVRQAKEELGRRAEGRDLVSEDGCWVLRESAVSYSAVFQPEKVDLSIENRPFWEIYPDFSVD